MACRDIPSYLRDDPELRREFPPKPLPGLMSSEMAAALDHIPKPAWRPEGRGLSHAL